MTEEEFNELRPSAFAIAYRMLGLPGVSLRPRRAHGGPGAVFLDAQQRLIAVIAVDTAGGRITSISSIVNPDKLAHLGPVADVSSLLGSAR